MIAVYPTLIAPWFNRFSPLDDESLRSRLQALLDKCHFRARGLFVMDGSRRSSHGNAYFTGFGAARRIVLFDTLISRLTPAELEAVLAHELGHFHHRHILKRMVVLFALSLGFLALLGWTAQQPWFHVGLGVSAISDAMSLLLFFMAVPCFTFLLQPLASLSSRKHEYQADAYAAQQAQRDDLISALVKLYQDNAATLTPDPLHSTFYDSHPPAALRIAHLQNLPQATVTA
jgi:STE24 endopeptidase